MKINYDFDLTKRLEKGFENAEIANLEFYSEHCSAQMSIHKKGSSYEIKVEPIKVNGKEILWNDWDENLNTIYFIREGDNLSILLEESIGYANTLLSKINDTAIEKMKESKERLDIEYSERLGRILEKDRLKRYMKHLEKIEKEWEYWTALFDAREEILKEYKCEFFEEMSY